MDSNFKKEKLIEDLQKDARSYVSQLVIVRKEADEIRKRNTELLKQLKESRSLNLDAEQLIADYKRQNDSQRFSYDLLLEEYDELEKLIEYKNTRIKELIEDNIKIDRLNYDLEIEIYELKERIKNPTFVKEYR